MAERMPVFAQGEGVDTIAEFEAFFTARQEVAARTLALLARIRNHGVRHIPDDDYIGYREYFCRQIAGWAVFYAVYERRDGTADVVVLLIAELTSADFDALLKDAILRHVDMVG